MAFEFPYNFAAGGVARASEVMANLNALKNKVNGELEQSDFAETGRILTDHVETTGAITRAGNQGAVAWTEYHNFVLPAASKMLLVMSADMEALANFGAEDAKIFGRTTVYIDNAATDCFGEVGNQSPAVTAGGVAAGVGTTKVQASAGDNQVFNLAAGSHSVMLATSTVAESTQGSPTVVFWNAKASWIIVPNAE